MADYSKQMTRALAQVLGLTGNATLLLGTIAGAMVEHGYPVLSVDVAAGEQVLRSERTGNTFLVSVTQLEGTE